LLLLLLFLCWESAFSQLVSQEALYDQIFDQTGSDMIRHDQK
jgi:hypothetical protein